ncbi:MAG TPA: EF-P lysine aminoacylase EpmA [Verrucomicrobiae bacterium]|nr:EF-P lysine aminoacylase EpmA [Verrucomicrobiae bacterium]
MTWRPSASLETLKARAALLARLRAFFMERGVLEVDTPVLSKHATVDVHVDSLRTTDDRWLQTSPEFPMKRLLAAGSGPIYQLCHVFRAGDLGRLHNPEFMMLEWYRPGFDHHRLMDEVAELVVAAGAPRAARRLSYREAWHAHAGIDPFDADLPALASALGTRAQLPTDATRFDRDAWLDFGMGLVVGPQLGRDAPEFVHDFPASQAALARIRPGAPPLAERFELFWQGLELANGFHELGDPIEQRQRFAADQARRSQCGKRVPPFDARLIEALEVGLPPCAGVALGVDRLLMLVLGLPDIAATMAFDWSRA